MPCSSEAKAIISTDGLFATGVPPAASDSGNMRKLSLMTARCIGACSIAPAVVYDGVIFPKQDPEAALAQVKGWLPNGR